MKLQLLATLISYIVILLMDNSLFSLFLLKITCSIRQKMIWNQALDSCANFYTTAKSQSHQMVAFSGLTNRLVRDHDPLNNIFCQSSAC
jgi:hypothetical protein